MNQTATPVLAGRELDALEEKKPYKVLLQPGVQLPSILIQDPPGDPIRVWLDWSADVPRVTGASTEATYWRGSYSITCHELSILPDLFQIVMLPANEFDFRNA